MMTLQRRMLFGILLVVALPASAAENLESDLLLGCVELGAKGFIQQAPAECVQLAKSGDPHIEAGIGIYYLGQSDMKNAALWFKKATDKGDPSGQNGLGYLYQTGQGVKENRKTANELFLKSAKQGNIDSAFWLGQNMILDKKYKEGFHWTSKAATNGSADAQYNLGALYKDGLGVKKDPGSMYFWLSMSATNGNEKAKEIISKMSAQMPKDTAQELDAYLRKRAAECPNCINRPAQ